MWRNIRSTARSVADSRRYLASRALMKEAPIRPRDLTMLGLSLTTASLKAGPRGALTVVGMADRSVGKASDGTCGAFGATIRKKGDPVTPGVPRKARAFFSQTVVL